MISVDVVVVAYNSRDVLRRCVVPFVDREEFNVVVVDNSSPDRSSDAVRDLAVRVEALTENGGFGVGCNAGARLGKAPYLLFLNPDATIEPVAVRVLADVLVREPGTAIVGPRIVHPDGSLDYSQRLFPSIRSTFARALFLHRLFPRARWSDEMIRDPRDYDTANDPDWISGACLLVSRDAFDAIDGFDESFFLYSEDVDLCRRLRDAGFAIRYEPTAVCVHEGGGSAPRASTLPLLTASRILYACKHGGALEQVATRAGLALEALVRVPLARDRAGRRGYVRAVRAAFSRPGCG